MKRKKSKRKVRQDQVFGVVNVGEDRTLTVHYDPHTDEIEIVGAEKGSTRTERNYERNSGKAKVVSSIPSNGKTSFTANRALLAYDWVIAVDTNTRMLFGKRCGVCVSYFTPKPPAKCDSDGVPFICLAAYLIVGIREEVNPEQIGWHLTLTKHVKSSQTPGQRIAIVVDSELGSHREINDRKKGYYSNNMLPAQITMVYASSDADNETLGGKMIQMCDCMATKVFDELETKSIPAPEKKTEDENYEAIYSVGYKREQGDAFCVG
jgi:hypothetical protein